MKHRTASPRKALYTFRGGIFLTGILFITILAGCPNAGLPPEAPSYTRVAFSDLRAYLRGKPEGGPYYIEVTGLTKWDLEATDMSVAPLGERLRSNRKKQVALKLPASVEQASSMFSCFEFCRNLVSVQALPAGITDISHCFYGCSSLAQAPAIPSSATNMHNCFQDCGSLTQGPEIPANVNNMCYCFYRCSSLTGITLRCNYVEGKFDHTFSGCPALEDGGIKVPSAYLQTYKDHAAEMDTTAEKFAAIP